LKEKIIFKNLLKQFSALKTIDITISSSSVMNFGRWTEKSYLKTREFQASSGKFEWNKGLWEIFNDGFEVCSDHRSA